MRMQLCHANRTVDSTTEPVSASSSFFLDLPFSFFGEKTGGELAGSIAFFKYHEMTQTKTNERTNERTNEHTNTQICQSGYENITLYKIFCHE